MTGVEKLMLTICYWLLRAKQCSNNFFICFFFGNFSKLSRIYKSIFIL